MNCTQYSSTVEHRMPAIILAILSLSKMEDGTILTIKE